MDYLATLERLATAPARYVWRRLGLEAEDFEYESRTSLPQPLGPTIYRQRFLPGTPARHLAQIVVVVSDEIVRDATAPERVRTLVAAAAAEGFDELREQLRRREAGSPGIEPGPHG